MDAPDVDLWTPLFWAVKEGSVSIAQLLVDRHASINHTDHHGNTPLHVACRHDHVDLVVLLLDQGACVALNNDRQSCLATAVQSGSCDVIMTIVRHSR